MTIKRRWPNTVLSCNNYRGFLSENAQLFYAGRPEGTLREIT